MNRQILLSNQLLPMGRLIAGVLILYILSNPAQAQQVVSVKAGMITYTEGEVSKDDEPVLRVRKEFLRLKEGQTLRTGAGHAEMLLSPNTYLRIGSNSSLRMERDLLKDTQLALERGSALIEIVQAAKGNLIHVRCGRKFVEISRAGLYRFDADPGELRVYAGTAVVPNDNERVLIKRGRIARLDGTLAVSKFDRDLADPLHEWAAQRSFYLFINNFQARWQMRNWTKLKDGGMYNTGFRVRFFWKHFLEAYAAEEKLKAAAQPEQEHRTKPPRSSDGS